jgi:hypothetical protein
MRTKPIPFVPTHTVIFDGEKGEGLKVEIVIPDNGTGYCRVKTYHEGYKQFVYSICDTARLAPISERNRLFRESLSPIQRAHHEKLMQRIAGYMQEGNPTNGN